MEKIQISELTRDESNNLKGGFSVKPIKLQQTSNFGSDNGNCSGKGWFDENGNCTGYCKECQDQGSSTEGPEN